MTRLWAATDWSDGFSSYANHGILLELDRTGTNERRAPVPRRGAIRPAPGALIAPLKSHG